jgi:hypothetical protein
VRLCLTGIRGCYCADALDANSLSVSATALAELEAQIIKVEKRQPGPARQVFLAEQLQVLGAEGLCGRDHHVAHLRGEDVQLGLG